MCVKKITHILLKSVAIYRHTNQTEVLKLNSNSKNRMIFRASFNVSLNIKKTALSYSFTEVFENSVKLNQSNLLSVFESNTLHRSGSPSVYIS